MQSGWAKSEQQEEETGMSDLLLERLQDTATAIMEIFWPNGTLETQDAEFDRQKEAVIKLLGASPEDERRFTATHSVSCKAAIHSNPLLKEKVCDCGASTGKVASPQPNTLHPEAAAPICQRCLQVIGSPYGCHCPEPLYAAAPLPAERSASTRELQVEAAKQVLAAVQDRLDELKKELETA